MNPKNSLIKMENAYSILESALLLKRNKMNRLESSIYST